MKYRDLIEFDAIETVLQLSDANSKARASEHVKTFVLSENLRKQLRLIVFPQLQFQVPKDNKGVLVVGNYGTGKTHLMSVISSIAEYPDLRPTLATDAEREKAKADGKAEQFEKELKELEDQIAKVQGNFKVIRFTLGATVGTLRDVVCHELTRGLGAMGVTYKFPAQKDITNHNDSFQAMMAAFDQKHPGKGLLLVVDELLDYLRGRDEQELMLDLAFLRELGEICTNTRFRFMAGLQESLFDNPAWQMYADNVKRVKDRHEQIRIGREDIAAVVSRRLLQKTAEQKKEIRKHLERFISLYPTLVNRMPEFVELFPVHPAYLDVFERIHVAERREVLKTLSKEMRELLDKDVPNDKLGLITYDTYWSRMHNDPSLLANPNLKEVLDRTQTLEAKVLQSFPKAAYKDTAVRVIHGLSVYRLTTPDIYAPIGLSPADLRDDLSLLIPNMPAQSADMLGGLVDVILKDILSTVNGQYISKNTENGQYYIDVKKAVDYDQNIAEQAKMLSDDQKDGAYFEALRKVILENPDVEPYVRGYKIWTHDLPWAQHNVDRPGYLFFGAPNERSTAQPPRDFYLYFLQPYKRPEFDDQEKPDEVFFSLKNANDEAFLGPLMRYGAATKLANTQTHAKQIYREKADKALKELVTWLSENLPTAMEVTWKGSTKLLSAWQTGGSKANVRDMVEGVASHCLNSWFASQYPNYPTFEQKVTRLNREDMSRYAIKHIVAGQKSKHSAAILAGLELLDGDAVRPGKSKYAKPVLDALKAKKVGQVVNRTELMHRPTPAFDWEVETENKLEAELFAVVLAALCNQGDIVLAYPGEKVDVSTISRLTTKSPTEVARFRQLETPKDLPRPALRALCRLLDVNENLVGQTDDRLLEQMVQQIDRKRREYLDQIVKRVQYLQNPPLVWGMPVVTPAQAKTYTDKLALLKTFLESLQAYDTPAKFVNFRPDVPEIEGHMETVALLKRLATREQHANRLGAVAGYLAQAELVMPEAHAWRKGLVDLRTSLTTFLAQEDPELAAATDLEAKLEAARASYRDAYIALHKSANLGVSEKERKSKLQTDPRLTKLRGLQAIPVVDGAHLSKWRDRLEALPTCVVVTSKDLGARPTCPECGFKPSAGFVPVNNATVAQMEDELTGMEEGWTKSLLQTLDDPVVAGQLELLEPKRKQAVESFRAKKQLSESPSESLVQGILEVLSGLQRVEVPFSVVRERLAASGSAGTPDEVKKRFAALVDHFTSGKGKDPAQVRIVFTDEQNEGPK